MLCKVDTVEMMPTEHDLALIPYPRLAPRGYQGTFYRGIGVSRDVPKTWGSGTTSLSSGAIQ